VTMIFKDSRGQPLAGGTVYVYDASGLIFEKIVLDSNGSMPQRTHTVKRGETLHGIAKRLSGASNPSEIAGYTRELSRANGDLPAGVVKEGTVLTVPLHFPDRPAVGWENGSTQDMALRFQQRTEIANDAERFYVNLRETREELVRSHEQLMETREELKLCREELRDRSKQLRLMTAIAWVSVIVGLAAVAAYAWLP
jgi:LysM domain